MNDGRIKVDERRVAAVNGVDICFQAFGEVTDPAILLIHGAGASMLGWPDSFCRRLAGGGRFVLRYDHRDTGESVSYEPGSPPYGQDELVRDAVGLLDAVGIDRAHIAGISMGGGIAQVVGVRHPERVESLTLMATTAGHADLPPPSPQFLEYAGGAGEPDWTDREAVIEHVLGFFRACAATPEAIDVNAVRAMLEQDIDRSTANIKSSQVNHFAAEQGESVRDRLGDIGVPTLVIHGRQDPVFPIAHGEALAQAIPEATLVALENVGHELPWEAGPAVADAILEHTSRRAS